jgi:hypothetical protein
MGRIGCAQRWGESLAEATVDLASWADFNDRDEQTARLDLVQDTPISHARRAIREPLSFFVPLLKGSSHNRRIICVIRA